MVGMGWGRSKVPLVGFSLQGGLVFQPSSSPTHEMGGSQVAAADCCRSLIGLGLLLDKDRGMVRSPGPTGTGEGRSIAEAVDEDGAMDGGGTEKSTSSEARGRGAG